MAANNSMARDGDSDGFERRHEPLLAQPWGPNPFRNLGIGRH